MSMEPLLFQRLVHSGTTENLSQEVFQTEVCQFPSVLFELEIIMRPANKASLTDFLWSKEIHSGLKSSESVRHVID